MCCSFYKYERCDVGCQMWGEVVSVCGCFSVIWIVSPEWNDPKVRGT